MDHFLILERFLRHLKTDRSALPYLIAGAAAFLLVAVALSVYFRKYLMLMAKGLGRNPLRTGLTSLAVMVLVFIFTVVFSFLVFLDVVMTERTRDFKAIITERWQVPSQMPFAYAGPLEEGGYSAPGDVHPTDSMTWQFYGGTLDPTNRSFENFMFFFAMDPHKLRTMMDDLENLDPALVEKLAATRDGAIIGRKRLAKLNKRIGERFKVTSYTLKGVDLDFEIVGVFPEGRYDQSGVMNREYLNAALDKYAREHGTRHPLADKTLALVWLRVPDSESFSKVSSQILNSGRFTAPAVKVETASSGISAFLEPYQTLLWGAKVFLVPALLVTMALVIANAIGLSVRERRTEMAVLKVLGFTPRRILALVLGEALLVGAGSGLLSAGLTYGLVHFALGGIPFPIAFFPIFDIFADALWWGVVFGGLTAVLGSLVPAWSARTVKVSEVFSKVT